MDQLKAAQLKVDQIQMKMQENSQKLLGNQEDLDALKFKTDELEDNALQFKKTAYMLPPDQDEGQDEDEDEEPEEEELEAPPEKAELVRFRVDYVGRKNPAKKLAEVKLLAKGAKNPKAIGLSRTDYLTFNVRIKKMKKCS